TAKIAETTRIIATAKIAETTTIAKSIRITAPTTITITKKHLHQTKKNIIIKLQCVVLTNISPIVRTIRYFFDLLGCYF
ncbi:MAG: hypothetical protein LBN22_01935, partial [Clostridiales Family XIII bacterium]|nr:hypothetical protein [Clostridiales Family XIII bacterium]